MKKSEQLLLRSTLKKGARALAIAFPGLPPTLTMDERNFVAEAKLVTSGIVPPDWTVMAHCKGHMEPGHWRAYFPPDVIDGQEVSSCPWCYCDWEEEMII